MKKRLKRSMDRKKERERMKYKSRDIKKRETERKKEKDKEEEIGEEHFLDFESLRIYRHTMNIK